MNISRTGLAATMAAGLISIGGMAAATPMLLDFSGTICNGGGACGNGSEIDQSYGDVAGELDVQWDASRSAAGLQNFLHWAGGYETLAHVGYGILAGGGAEISFVAASGFGVTLHGFDIAPYLDRVRDSYVAIFDMATNTELFSETLSPVSIAGVTSYTDPGDWTSSVGLRLLLGPDIWDVGVSNIDYSTFEDVVPIPLPAPGLLLLGALAAVGMLRRRGA